MTIDFREGKLFLLSTTVSIACNEDSWIFRIHFIALTVTSVMELLGLVVRFRGRTIHFKKGTIISTF